VRSAAERSAAFLQRLPQTVIKNGKVVQVGARAAFQYCSIPMGRLGRRAWGSAPTATQ
jgi:hypothetical protein